MPLEWRLWADALTWIPADAKAYRRRGFDHMGLIARSLGEQTGLRAVPLLEKLSRADQRKLNRAERQRNMETLFSVIEPGRDASGHDPPVFLKKAHLILIDDVFTTGATLDAAARTLRAAGVGEIRVATVVRVW
jgi:predicted amidophosphoribosyltransferase